MAEDRLPTSLLVAAHIRQAARQGVPMVVRHRGDKDSGAIILKINRLDGTAQVLVQARCGDELVWNAPIGEAFLAEVEADQYLLRQKDLDPDSWLIEIEDKQGRHWFPGRIML